MTRRAPRLPIPEQLAGSDLSPRARLVVALVHLGADVVADIAGAAGITVDEAEAELAALGAWVSAADGGRWVPGGSGLRLAARADDAAREVYRYWRETGRHVRALAEPSESDLRLIGRALTTFRREHARAPDASARAVAEARRVIDWIHAAPSARWWRGIGRRDGDTRTSLAISDVFRTATLPRKVADAREWDAAGRPADTGAPQAPGAHREAAARAWAWLVRMARYPEIPWADLGAVEPRKVAALRVAVDAAGGWGTIRASTDRNEREIRAGFVSAFEAAMDAPAPGAARAAG